VKNGKLIGRERFGPGAPGLPNATEDLSAMFHMQTTFSRLLHTIRHGIGSVVV